MPYITKSLFSAVFMIAAMLVSPSARAAANDAVTVRTVVIDAGHGGHDAGAVSGSVKEKDINLDIALSLGRMITEGYPGVNVIYTRSTDVFVPLVERSSIANRNKADLFISIHSNSARSTAAYGTETFIMGTDKSQSNLELCKRENSVITLESDYTTTYAGYNPDDTDSYIFFNLMQSAQFEQSIYMASMVEEKFSDKGPIRHTRGIKQGPLLVLWQTTMPSVLVEVGFVSNASDRSVLTDDASRERIAECIYSAFSDYKRHYDPSSEAAVLPAPKEQVTIPAKTETAKPASKKAVKKAEKAAEQTVVSAAQPTARPAVNAKPEETVYRIQFLASSRKISAGARELQGIKDFDCIFINGLYKYVVGCYASREDAAAALPEVKKLFEGAFIVKMDGHNNFVK